MYTDLLEPVSAGPLGAADTWVFVVLAGTAVLAGAAVQSTVGLGLGLVAAPVISFLDPTLMPGAMLIAAVLLPVLTLVQEWKHVDWRGVAWGLPARLPGTLAGVWVVATLQPRALAGLVGVMVLTAVVLSVWSFRVRLTPGSLVVAGCLSGFAGTATSVGGPPMALLYQYEPPSRVRATLAAFFLFGASVSLAALGAGGQLDARTVVVGVAALPFVGAGFALGNVVRRRIDGARLRVAMLCVVTVSAIGLLGQAFLG
ncbi:sulfite exporter TauE/SafE family protein [Nocardiopsis sp. FIRDI 009]|uniref:sulfite exporter TauE/SafE family protein n=1 Tax=Nocardiopsis sp. FIRDI 009 TaxID=714197 RepID=UPI000E280AE3|nr:sulfite exporter TauE/SafE family protein [Nocardiopsis sp. FIRDI 009]